LQFVRFTGSGATPAAELGPSAEPFDCLSSGPGILAKCSKEVEFARKGTIIQSLTLCFTYIMLYANGFLSIRTLTAEIDFGQTEIASQGVIDGIVDQLQDEGLPTAACCDIAVTFNENACQCDPVLTGLLPEVGIQVNALLSILKVMEAVCGSLEIQEC